MSYKSDHVQRAARMFRATLDAQRGSTFQATFRDFIAEQLSPHRFRVASAVVLGDLEEATTISCVIFDAESAPRIPIDDGGTQLTVADSVFGAIEIVDDLDKRSLEKAAESIAALKRMRRPMLVDQGQVQNPYLGALMAASGMVAGELLDAVAELNQDIEFGHQIDIICVLDQGLVSFVEVDPDGSITLELPVEASPRWRLSWMPLGGDALFAFYLALWQSLASRPVRAASMHQLLRMLPGRPGKTLEAPCGLDIGE